MGYTAFSKDNVKKLIDEYQPKTVLDYGSQNDFSMGVLPAPYISEWFESLGIKYTCIDLNGENNALQINLSYPITESLCKVQMVIDNGTVEHLERNGQFDWEAIYWGWKNKHDLLEIGGIMYSENPKTGSWPKHGYNYHTKGFYQQLWGASGYGILELGEHPSSGNSVDGWNIFCSMKKHSEIFPTPEQFKTFDIRQS